MFLRLRFIDLSLTFVGFRQSGISGYPLTDSPNSPSCKQVHKVLYS